MKRIIACTLLALPSFAGEPWSTAVPQWTEQDATRILNSSPWAKTDGRSQTVVRWNSARPVRLAAERLHLKTIDTETQSSYVISVMGGNIAKGEQRAANLKAAGREPVQAVEARVADQAIVFFFPRAELRQPVVFRLPMGVKLGNDVEFEARIGSRVVREKFSLAKMTYLGNLEL